MGLNLTHSAFASSARDIIAITINGDTLAFSQKGNIVLRRSRELRALIARAVLHILSAIIDLAVRRLTAIGKIVTAIQAAADRTLCADAKVTKGRPLF